MEFCGYRIGDFIHYHDHDLVTDRLYTYKTIGMPGEGRIQEKGSKFISAAFHMSHIEALERQLAACKADHPKGRHVCYAYRMLDGDEIVEYSSDAGEPPGSAGKPILGVLASGEVVNAGIVVVRYFGGTKLGIPGLIQAYRSAAEDALRKARLSWHTRKRLYQLNAPHALQPLILEHHEKFGIELRNPVYDTHFHVEMAVPLENIESRLRSFLTAVAQREYEDLPQYLEALDMTLEARDEHS